MDRTWEHVADKVVIGVKTGHEVAKERLEWIQSTWLACRRGNSKLRLSSICLQLRPSSLTLNSLFWFLCLLSPSPVPNILFLSDEADNTTGTWSVRDYEHDLIRGRSSLNRFGLYNDTFQGGWKGDKDKNLPALALMYDHFPDKSFYFLVDDDTYVLLDNFAEFVSQHDIKTSIRKKVCP